MKLFGFALSILCIVQVQPLEFDNSLKDVLPSVEDCGRSSGASKFPWVTYLPLASRVYNPQAKIQCAGALITKRYVLSSKSCLQFILSSIKFGAEDISKTEPFIEERNVEKRFVDDNLDIVLLKLEKDVEFTDYIKPICLPFKNFDKPEIGDIIYTSGWGLTAIEGPSSNIKKTVKQTLLNKDQCPNPGKQHEICVKKDKDEHDMACNGDEGSPMMFETKDKQWVIRGILTNVFDSESKPCSPNSAEGIEITDDVLQWIVNSIKNN